jgi:hypothetical protein
LLGGAIYSKYFNQRYVMKKKIALVTGGFSGEAQISYKSATTIFMKMRMAANRLLIKMISLL